MACFTKVMVTLDNDKYTIEARKKLGLPLKGEVDEETARAVKLEASKIKTVSVMRALNPGALIKGNLLGSKKLTIQIDI